jgi:hypothetical protein
MLMAINPVTYSLAMCWARKAAEVEFWIAGSKLWDVEQREIDDVAWRILTERKAELLGRAAVAVALSPQFPSGGQRRKRCSPSTIPVQNSRP